MVHGKELLVTLVACYPLESIAKFYKINIIDIYHISKYPLSKV